MSDLFRKEAMEHQKDRLMGDVILLQPLSLAVLTAIALLVAASIVGLLFWGSYARKETVRGFLTPDRGIVKIYPQNSGTITHVYVKDGQMVEQGDPLFTVVAERSLTDGNDVDSVLMEELEKEMREIEVRIESEKEISVAETHRLEQQTLSIAKEIKALESGIKLHQERIQISEKRLEDVRSLLEKKHVAPHEVRKLEEEHLTLKQQGQELERNLSTKEAQQIEVDSQLIQLPLQTQARIIELQKNKSEIRQRLVEVQGRKSGEIKAPMTGLIDGMQVSEGQWINQMQPTPMVALIPNDSYLQAEIYVPTRAVGFLKEGQSVKIRYDAFPYQRYGVYQGKVLSVSAHIYHPSELPVPMEIGEPVYRVIVQLEEQAILAYGQQVALQAGMSVEADIILEQQSLFDWILDPIYSLRGRA